MANATTELTGNFSDAKSVANLPDKIAAEITGYAIPDINISQLISQNVPFFNFTTFNQQVFGQSNITAYVLQVMKDLMN